MNDLWNQCWNADPNIYKLLKDSSSLEEARDSLIHYLEELYWKYQKGLAPVDPWDFVLFNEAHNCLINIISPRNESRVGFSTLEHLWQSTMDGSSLVEKGFVYEFLHLFKALNLKADVYPSSLMEGVEQPDYDRFEGREAAILRSNFLDTMGKRMDRFLSRYPHGLDKNIVRQRQENRDRILDVLGGTEDDWDDWLWQFRSIFKDQKGLEQIQEIIHLEPDRVRAIELALGHKVPFGVTPHYLHLMDREPTERDYAVRAQVFPPWSYVKRMIELRSEGRHELLDFMRERDTSPVDLVTRRYPRVAIIKPYDSCPQICVYCQRNWEITSPLMPHAMASHQEIDTAIDWFAEHEEMMDVLVTGGDPLTMGNRNLEYIIRRLSEIPHMHSIRLATRMPITVPQRLTEELCQIFADYYELGKQTLYMVTHFMHPYEVSPETAAAIRRVKMHGMGVYNQEVFTFANSRKFETAALRVAIKQIGVDPYYTFNMKGKEEMKDYAVPIARILQERKEEARLLPGIFRTDEPVFNVPGLGKDHLRAWQNHELIAITPEGRRMYAFLPWEKNIVQIKPYIYTDVPIDGYLQRLTERGEDTADYRSIWYYY